MDTTTDPTKTLLAKINAAVAAANVAEQTAETARVELVSKSKAVGLLLLEAKQLHPKVKEFEAFLKRVDGLGRSRAYDLMRLAGGRVTDDELKQDARERQQKSRAKKKLPKPAPAPALRKREPHKDSVTVTEIPASAREERKTDSADALSARALGEFCYACQSYFPKMTESDRQKALKVATEWADLAEAA